MLAPRFKELMLSLNISTLRCLIILCLVWETLWLELERSLVFAADKSGSYLLAALLEDFRYRTPLSISIAKDCCEFELSSSVKWL